MSSRRSFHPQDTFSLSGGNTDFTTTTTTKSTVGNFNTPSKQRTLRPKDSFTLNHDHANGTSFPKKSTPTSTTTSSSAPQQYTRQSPIKKADNLFFSGDVEKKSTARDYGQAMLVDRPESSRRKDSLRFEGNFDGQSVVRSDFSSVQPTYSSTPAMENDVVVTDVAPEAYHVPAYCQGNDMSFDILSLDDSTIHRPKGRRSVAFAENLFTDNEPDHNTSNEAQYFNAYAHKTSSVKPNDNIAFSSAPVESNTTSKGVFKAHDGHEKQSILRPTDKLRTGEGDLARETTSRSIFSDFSRIPLDATRSIVTHVAPVEYIV
eukprot:m.42630 g.42630  ORF g.42630 m.42630 type:complete len:318 (-) comp7068_c0_seq1:2743-3696(-)